MLNIQSGKDHTGIHVEASGSNGEIITELAIAFNVIYRGIVSSSPKDAGDFKAMMKLAMMDDNSPFWKDLGIGGETTVVHIDVPEK